MKLTEINIYPIKSMGRISLTEATVLPVGLQYDRRWLLLDAESNFMTQRNYPQMARIKFKWEENGFTTNYIGENYDSINIPFEAPDSPIITTQVWKDKVEALAMSDEINNWFSEIFKQNCQLVRIVENAVRKNMEGNPDKISSFADITPFLIIGENSLVDLNSHLATPVPMTRFRPNFVFSGGDAFCEDDWDEFKIGDIHFKKYKKCGRCKVTTIDQDTGEKMGDEPLATLGKYRKKDKQLNFGVRAFLKDGQGESIIKLNDEVKIL